MEQLAQNLKSGEMQIMEVPFPALNAGCILVRNHFSIISAGTEGKSVKDARLGYIAKARARKEEVAKVIQAVRSHGLIKTYQTVMNRLETPSPLGYSCAGEVIAVASDVRDFKIGDLVACGGNSASHAEVVSVPVNLAVKVPNGVDLRFAAFSTLGAIALQGIRQADLRLGENAVVIGLGLIGQLTVQMLNAAGVKTIGIDIDERMVKLAQQNKCTLALNRNDETIQHRILEFTDGHGTDAVIITAGTSSTDPVDIAGELCRKKGKVIIVGAVPTGFKRQNYFKKELDLRMSSSYGPGRYDREYEEEGIDYPYAYVRWTENRNMQAFVSMLESRAVNPEKLISHNFPFAEAIKAYDILVNKTEPFTGIILSYDVVKNISASIQIDNIKSDPAKPAIGFIGAGNFAQSYLLPCLKGKAALVSVCTSRALNAKHIAGKYGFARCPGTAEEIFSDKDVNTVFIATRHDSHAEYVLKALKSGKNVFVEKPLCLYPDELNEIKNVYLQSGAQLMLGFNRRYSPFVKELKKKIADGKCSITYRINAGYVASNHWVHDPKIGGGRIIGEVCHFIDLASYIAGSPIESVSAISNSSENDTVTIQLSFRNGSIAAVNYFSNGDKELPKEHLEVFSNGVVAVINDFCSLQIYGKRPSKIKGKQDKGHQSEVEAFLEAIRSGNTAIPFDEIYNSMLATFKVMESIKLKGERMIV